jgi:DNA (cytosine-5)-methyltransferase 1
MITIGSLYAGIGGLDLACEWGVGGCTVWQLDQVGADVRRRHWPDALQIEADVATVDPLDLPLVDVLCAGFACQDLSVAGAGAARGDLHAGTRTGPTWRGVVRFVEAIHPEIVVLENVPVVLHLRAQIEREILGYGWTWVRCGAWDAGAPHIRRRAFAVGIRGDRGSSVINAPTDGRWPVESGRTCGTPRASTGHTAHYYPNDRGRVEVQISVRTWATPNAGDFKGGPGDGCQARGGHQASMAEQIRTWPALTNRGNDNRQGLSLTSAGGLGTAVRPWATPAARDHKTGDLSGQFGTPSLSQMCSEYPRGAWGSRLNPAWVEILMGYPEGWALPDGPQLDVSPSPRWPRGRYPKGWDRSIYWPGYEWEPPRTLPDGPPVRGRPSRIRALGNAVVPQQGALALACALAPRQIGLFG